MKELPQVHPESGISQDYWNEYNSKVFAYDSKRNDFLTEICKNYPVRKYEEVYPRDKYNHNSELEIINKIKELDVLAESFNDEFNGVKPFNEDKFRNIINKAYKIIYGKNEDYYQ